MKKQSKAKREGEKICCGERSKAHDQTIYRQSREQWTVVIYEADVDIIWGNWHMAAYDFFPWNIVKGCSFGLTSILLLWNVETKVRENLNHYVNISDSSKLLLFLCCKPFSNNLLFSSVTWKLWEEGEYCLILWLWAFSTLASTSLCAWKILKKQALLLSFVLLKYKGL